MQEATTSPSLRPLIRAPFSRRKMFSSPLKTVPDDGYLTVPQPYDNNSNSHSQPRHEYPDKLWIPQRCLSPRGFTQVFLNTRSEERSCVDTDDLNVQLRTPTTKTRVQLIAKQQDAVIPSSWITVTGIVPSALNEAKLMLSMVAGRVLILLQPRANFYIIRLNTPEEAQRCLRFSGSSLRGQLIKVALGAPPEYKSLVESSSVKIEKVACRWPSDKKGIEQKVRSAVPRNWKKPRMLWRSPSP